MCSALLPLGGESELFHMFTDEGWGLTSDYLFCRFVRSLALVGHQGLGHIGVSKWREELQENRPVKSGATPVYTDTSLCHRSARLFICLVCFDE